MTPRPPTFPSFKSTSSLETVWTFPWFILRLPKREHTHEMAATAFEPASAYSMMEVEDHAAASSAETSSSPSSTTGDARRRSRDSGPFVMDDLAPSNKMEEEDEDEDDRMATVALCAFAAHRSPAAKSSRTATPDDDDMMEMSELAYHQYYHQFSHASTDYGFSDLPEELVYLIFTFLHGRDLCNGVQKVCRSWRRLALDDQVSRLSSAFILPLLLFYLLFYLLYPTFYLFILSYLRSFCKTPISGNQ